MSKITACLWFDTALHGGAEPAARFYTDLFPDSSLDAVHRSPSDYPGGKKDDVLMVEFTLMGVKCTGLNGGGRPNTARLSPSRFPPKPRKKPTVTGRL
jgi:2-polyprenyl-6-hydroxyphenyl methylase/3-demethylubiquinone-9 3-methyltransferase